MGYDAISRTKYVRHNKFLFKRFYSTSNLIKSSLNPQFVTGFTDAEGSFQLIIRKNAELKVGWSIELKFAIGLHIKELALLEAIQKIFGVGKLYNQGENAKQFRVSSIKDIELIINHFDKYPLISQKQADYLLFKQAIDLIKNKEHLTISGVQKIVALKASMNLGLSDELKAAFPDIIPVDRPVIRDQVIPDPNWIAGFASGEGCFLNNIYKSKTKTGLAVNLVFKITLDIRDEQLMRSLINYFNCGYCRIRSNKNVLDFEVLKFSDITENIIPFFEKYKIIGIKVLDYQDFKTVAELMKNKEHLEREGLENIKKIKSGINTGRK